MKIGTTIGGSYLPATRSFAIRPRATLIFDGDSLTAFGWYVPMETTINVAFAAAGKANPTYHNAATAGKTSTETLASVGSVIALAPDHIFLLSSINDRSNHGGAPIPPATTAANYTAYFAAIAKGAPNCMIHVVSNLWDAGENWPDGANVNDATTVLMNTAIQGAVAACSFARYLDIRTPIYGIDEPANNPTHLTSGALTSDGTHPIVTSGQAFLSSRVFSFLTFDFTGP